MSAPFTPPFAKMAIHRETHSRSRCRETMVGHLSHSLLPRLRRGGEKILSTRRSGWLCWDSIFMLWHASGTHELLEATLHAHGTYKINPDKGLFVDEGGGHQVPLLAEELLTTGSGLRKENWVCLGMRPPHLYWQHWADLVGFKNRTYEIEKE